MKNERSGTKIVPTLALRRLPMRRFPDGADVGPTLLRWLGKRSCPIFGFTGALFKCLMS